MQMISEEDTRALFGNLSAALQSLDRGHVKARLRALLSKVEVDPATISARIYYAIPAATGDSVASPRGTPGYINQLRRPIAGVAKPMA